MSEGTSRPGFAAAAESTIRADQGVADEFLAPLLQTLAESLDVREIFARISAEARRIVRHDFLMLGILSADHQRVRVVALSGELPEATGEVRVDPVLRPLLEQRQAIVFNDVRPIAAGTRFTCSLRLDEAESGAPTEAELQPIFRHLVVTRGCRSFLRVAIRLRDGVLGGIIFCAAAPDAFPRAEVARARQVANCVALALAHQRLAEEEQRAAEARARADRLESRVQRLTEELEAHGRHRILGQSASWRQALDHARKVSATEATVLLTGESGTGKEVVARYIHRASPRAEGPFVALNCAALPEQLLESELFGHEKGAFTGALSARAGKIEQATGGVLFLDEVGEMSPGVQAKLLRVLQEREYQRVGGARTLRADLRLLAATNRNLKAAVAQGGFREDLYYRLAVFDIPLPPLRERAEDLPALIDAFVEEFGRAVGRPAAGLALAARERLGAYPWPGNVRELRNVIERAVILCEGGLITPEHLPRDLVDGPTAAAVAAAAGGPRTLGDAERAMIVAALEKTGHNKSKAARLLGLTRAQLRSRLEKHAIADPA